MKVLVVGGAGYVGGAVTDRLIETGHTCRVYDALLYEESYRKPVDFVYGDVRDTAALKPQLAWADVVVWLAALVGDAACQLNADITTAVNQQAVQFLSENFHGRIIFLSTCSVYGAQENLLSENSPVNPLSIYAATKLLAERYLEKSNALIFRLGTLFGVGDQYSRLRLDLVVNSLTAAAICTGKLSVFGGDQFRPLLHVRDAAQAIVDNISTSHCGLFNLHRQNVRIIDLAYQVRNHFPDLIIEQTSVEFQDTRNYRVSSHKAESVLGFKAKNSIDDGIQQIKDLIETGRLKQIDNPRYANDKFLSIFRTHKVIAKSAGKGNGLAAAAHTDTPVAVIHRSNSAAA